MSSLSTVFNFIPLSEAEEKQVLSSVGYTKSRLEADLLLLRTWVAQQPHFPPSSLTENDDFFINYLVGCKGSIERCKKKLDGYYSWRRRSTIFADRNPISQRFVDSSNSVTLALMPKCLPTGYRLNFMKFKSSENFDLIGTFRHIALLTDLRIRCVGISAGDTNVVDCANFSAAFLPSFNPAVFRDMLIFFQDCLAHRCDQYYFINCPAVAHTVFNKMMKPFMSKKMSERESVVTSWLSTGGDHFRYNHNQAVERILDGRISRRPDDDVLTSKALASSTQPASGDGHLLKFTVTGEGNKLLLERFPKEILPKEYGGEGPSTDSIHEKLVQSLFELGKEGEGGLISRLSELTDESKRPKDSQFTVVDDSLFGVQGTIKSLTID